MDKVPVLPKNLGKVKFILSNFVFLTVDTSCKNFHAGLGITSVDG